MKSNPEPVHSGEMLRANTAVALVLIAVLLLALVAVLAGLRAARNQARAQEAEAAAQDRLWNACLTEARAVRATTESGRRQNGLNVISNAIAIRTSPELRSQAIACLALTDLTQEGNLLPTPRDLQGAEMDPVLGRYAYGDNTGKIYVCDAHNGKLLFNLQAADLGAGMRMAVGDLSFSPDGKTLAARFAGGAVVVWDLEQQARRLSLGTAATNVTMTGLSFFALSGLSYSPDSSKIIFSDPETGGLVSVYDIATGQRLSSAVKVGTHVFRLSPDLKRVAVATESTIQLMDYPGGTNVQSLTHGTRVAMVAWSPDGEQLAVSCESGDVNLWEFSTGAARLLPGHSERCVRMGYNPDGTLLYSSSRDGSTRLWDVSLGQAVAAGEGIAQGFTPDGEELGFWRPWAGFGVWHVTRSPFYSIHGCARSEGPLFTLDLSPSGRWCVATQNKGFRIWDLQSGKKEDKEYYVRQPEVFCVRVAPDEKSLFVCRHTGLERWPLLTNAAGDLDLRPENATSIPLPEGSRGTRAISLSLDGHTAAVELGDRRMFSFDLDGKREPVAFKDRWRSVNYKGPGSPTGAGRFTLSPDGRWLITGFDFGLGDAPKIWDAQTGDYVMPLKAKTSVAGFSPDGKTIGLAGLDRISIWSVGDWKLETDFQRDEFSVTHGTIAFSKSGDLVADSRTRQIIQLSDRATHEKIADLLSPVPQSENSVRMSLDGSLLVTATASDMVEVWHLDRLQRELAGMHLDWEGSGPGGSSQSAPQVARFTGPMATLVLSLAGVVVAGIFAMFILRQHRANIARFITAEAKAAQHNRELEMAKVELMHSQKMQALGTLATGIAHDFNNLLSVIRMSNKLVARTAKDDPEIQEYTSDIEQAAVQGKNVVRSMVGYARNESQASGPLNVNEVVEGTVALLNKEFLSGIQLMLELSPGIEPVNIHQGRLEQILLNLIVNASEAMKGHGKLKITTHLRSANHDRPAVLRPRTAPHYVELTVGDSGPGIPPEILGRIFEPFFSTKRSAATPGTGLGLSLVYTIAQQDGMGLSVQSAPGAGATFLVLIPVAAVESPGAGTSPVRETHTVQAGSLP